MIQPKAFYNLVRPELPGITEPMLDFNIVQTCADFCQTARVWQEPLIRQNTVAGQDRYSLIATYGQPLSVLHLRINGMAIWDRRKHFNARYSRYHPPFRVSQNVDTLTLTRDEVPSDTQAGGFQVLAVLQPRVNDALVPDVLFNQFADEIRQGTLSRLMLMAGKPWSNPQLGAFYAGEYARKATLAANRALNGNTDSINLTDPLPIGWKWLGYHCMDFAELEDLVASPRNVTLLTTDAISTGEALSRPGDQWNYALFVTGSGSITATVTIQVSYDGQNWLDWGTLSCSGTDAAQDSLANSPGVYDFQRAVVTYISAGATLEVVGAGD